LPNGTVPTDNHARMRFSNNDPDLILCARRCDALGGERGRVEAVAIKGNHIMGLGSRRVVSKLKGRGTKWVDLGDGIVTPGLVDCHTHFFYWALHRALTISVSDCRSREETLTRIRRQARRRSVGDWIVALGFDYNPWPEGRPSAADLDRVIPVRPVIVLSRDVHTAWLNSAALRRVGITARTPDPKGGRFLRDSRGRPTGIAQEAAVDLLPDPVWEFAGQSDAAAVRAIDQALEEAYRLAWSFGIVGVHAVDGAASLNHLQRQHRERRLGIRVVHAIPHANLPHAKALGLRAGWGDRWLRLGGVKLFADGALGSQTAYMFRPYPGSNGNCGVPITAGDELREIAVDAARSGWALWVHAIGDRAVHEAVAAIGAARRVEQRPLQHRIEHAQCARPADIRKMARSGIIASVQPAHIMGDIRTAERHWPQASRNAYAFRSMAEAGVTLAMGSDVPVESIDPRRSLFGAVARTDEEGYPKGGWYARQRLSVREVLWGFTRGAAAAVGGSKLAGTLGLGAPADLTIWHDDPLAARPEELRDLRIAGCVVAGQLHLTD
jgi:predicted amidohydrolase YtcJ